MVRFGFIAAGARRGGGLLLGWLVVPVVLFAQAPDVVNLPNFEEIARDGKIAYFVNFKDADRNGRWITVDVMGAHYQAKPFALNNIAYIVTTFRIDCELRTGQRLRDKGVWKGEPVDESFKNPKIDKPSKSRRLFVVIATVCGDKKMPYKWTGGNGCNLIGGGEAEKACCVDHDRIYRTGGNMRSKWQADSELFKCIWKRNPLLAAFSFVGSNVGGLFAFRWGNARNLDGMDGTKWERIATDRQFMFSKWE